MRSRPTRPPRRGWPGRARREHGTSRPDVVDETAAVGRVGVHGRVVIGELDACRRAQVLERQAGQHLGLLSQSGDGQSVHRGCPRVGSGTRGFHAHPPRAARGQTSSRNPGSGTSAGVRARPGARRRRHSRGRLEVFVPTWMSSAGGAGALPSRPVPRVGTHAVWRPGAWVRALRTPRIKAVHILRS